MVARNTARSADTGGEDKAWFAPKRYGYGAGLPIARQGWAVISAYFLVVGLSVWLVLPRSVVTFVAIIIGATAALILICAMKTRGGWKWRWGDDA